MKLDKSYVVFLIVLKDAIVSSKYKSARLLTKEQLLLYYNLGAKLSDKIALEKWGSAILKNIAKDLQISLPGLRGFSERSLYNMKLFYEAYRDIEFPQLPTAETNSENQNQISQLPTAKFDDFRIPF